MRVVGVAVGCLAALALVGCGTPGKTRRPSAPARVRLGIDVPRPDASAVSERWALARNDEGTFLVHGIDVERRRTRQTCGVLAEAPFLSGWADLKATGVLRPGEDLRLVAPPGSPAFAARLEGYYGSVAAQVFARRPLTQDETRAVSVVLRRWEALLQPVATEKIPADLRVELARGGCGPPGRRRTKGQPAIIRPLGDGAFPDDDRSDGH